MKRKAMQTKANNKGFTLVEIIVVLVILAILAAFTIPAMLGFVEDARGKAYIGEARELYTATQAALTEYAPQSTSTNYLFYDIYQYGVDGQSKTYLNPITYHTETGYPEATNLDKSVASKILSLISNDVNLEKNRANNAKITIDTKTAKVKTVVLDKNGYTVTLDIEHGTTDVVKN
jgi:type IV pilus assembly protein PilA